LPGVTSDIPGLEWARRAPAAEFFHTEDRAAMAAAIGRVLDWRSGARAERTRRSAAYVRENLGVVQWAKRVSEMYETVLEGGRKVRWLGAPPSADQ
jgi:hypothetical protein